MIRITLGAAVALAATLAIARPVLAGPFDGTWKADMSTYKASAKPYTNLLANGHYHCTCSNPPEDFPTDGKFHPVTGHHSYDEAMAQVIDAKTVRFAYKLKGKPTFEVTSTLSDDGKTETDRWTDTSSPKTVTGEGQEIRVKAGPKGAHAISGVWRDSDKLHVSDDGVVVTYKQVGDTLEMTAADGTSFAAKFGGPFVPVAHDPVGGMVAVARKGDTLIVTRKVGGKLTSRAVAVFAPDGKTVRIASTSLSTGRTESFSAVKQ